MCRKAISVVMDNKEWIKTLMDQLLDIPSTAATLILQSILILMGVSNTMRDHLIMVLRKALYRKGTELRRMAVLGFLQVLKSIKLSSRGEISQSQSRTFSDLTSASSASILSSQVTRYFFFFLIFCIRV